MNISDFDFFLKQLKERKKHSVFQILEENEEDENESPPRLKRMLRNKENVNEKNEKHSKVIQTPILVEVQSKSVSEEEEKDDGSVKFDTPKKLKENENSRSSADCDETGVKSITYTSGSDFNNF